MPRGPKKGLSLDDIEVWRSVAKTVAPLEDSTVMPEAAPEALSVDDGKSVLPAAIPKPRKASGPPASLPPKMPRQSPRLDGNTHDKLRRGKLRPERRVDLHGMTAARAHSALIHFILSAYSDGCRVVLVITGKGSSDPIDDNIIPRRRGVIRQSLPQWIATPPLNDKVLQATPAKDRDGGGGAFYLYLKRQRATGRSV